LFEEVLKQFEDFLKQEVLLKDINKVEKIDDVECDIKKVYEDEDGQIYFCLKK
jgi:hypothetical protein